MRTRELMVKAAWLYHVEGLTQAQIGERMRLTRRRVNELLALALESGVVHISFGSPLVENAELEARLCARFGLDEAVVAPVPEKPAAMASAIGWAAAGFLDRLIASASPASMGVGWGTTLRETVRHVRPVRQPQLTVCSMMGGLTRGAEINTFEIVHSFAQVLDAKCRYFAAPIYVDCEASRALVVAQPVFRDLLEEATRVELSFLGTGDVTGRSLQVRYGLPPQIDIEGIVAAGGVGDLLGYYLDEWGRPVDHPINTRVMAPDLEEYRAIPRRVVLAGGRHKRPILLAILRAQLATAVVTDAHSAKWLLKQARQAD